MAHAMTPRAKSSCPVRGMWTPVIRTPTFESLVRPNSPGRVGDGCKLFLFEFPSVLNHPDLPKAAECLQVLPELLQSWQL